MDEAAGPLRAVFLQHVPDPEGWRDEPDLEAALGALVRRAQAAWPRWSVPSVELVRHVAAQWAPGVRRSLEVVYAEDIYWVLACLRAVPEAIVLIDKKIRQQGLAVLHSRIRPPPPADQAEEILQIVMDRLLVAGGEGRAPLLAEYGGRGPLGAWLDRVIYNRALDEIKATERRERHGWMLHEVSYTPAGGPEKELLQQQCVGRLAMVLQTALGRLEVRQQELLRMRYKDHLSGPEIAVRYGVDKATANRHIKRAEDEFLALLEQEAKAQMGLAEDEFGSLMKSLMSRLVHWL